MNDESYLRRFTRAVAWFAGIQTGLVLLVVATNHWIGGQNSKWLNVAAGTLAFPTLAYAGMELAPPESKAAIHFPWWDQSAFVAPAIVSYGR